MPDLSVILDRIRQQPDDEAGWLALVAHLHEHGEQDLATVIRSHWPVCRECMREGDSAEESLHRIRTISLRDLARLAQKARDREERDLADHD
jgi:hypothetical protein